MHYSVLSRMSFRLALLVLLTTSGILGAMQYPRISRAAPVLAVESYSVIVRAGSAASIPVRGIAIEPGSSIPPGPLTLASAPLASDRLRTTLFYAIDWGYSQSAPHQVALAVWYTQEGTWREANHTIAERLVKAASSSQGTPGWNPEGRSLLPMVGKQVLVENLVLTPAVAEPAIGTGKLTLRNTGSQDLRIYLPYGALFSSPSGNALVWATAPNEAQAEQTVQPAPTENPTETAVLVDPPPAERTATPSYKPGSTPVATATASYKATRPTPTAVEGSNIPPAATPPPAETPTPVEEARPGPTIEPPTPAPSLPASPDPANSSNSGKPQPLAIAGSQDKAGNEGKAVNAAVGQPVTESALPLPAIKAAPQPVMPKAQPTSKSAITLPSPVSTEGTEAVVPLPVATGGSGSPTPRIPSAERTVGVPVEITITKPTIAKPTLTSPPTPTAFPTIGAVARGGTSDSPAQKPQPAPKVSSASDQSPVTSVKSSDSDTRDTTAKPGVVAASQAQTSGAPTGQPATGGGQSTTGIWLAAAAALLTAAGIRLRRSATQSRVSGENHAK